MALWRAGLIGGAVLAAIAIVSIWRLQDPVVVPPATVDAPPEHVDAPPMSPVASASVPAEAAAVLKLDLVRIEPSGESVFAGSAEPGAEVQVRIGEEVIASARADSDGNFVTYGTVSPGEGVQRLELWVAEAGQAPKLSQAPVFVTRPRPDSPDPAPEAAETAPQPQQQPMVVQAQPEGVSVLQSPARPAGQAVTLDLVSYSSEGWLEISGRAEALRLLRVYANAVLIAETWVSADGRWSTRAAAGLAPGDYTLRVDMLAEDGAVRGRVESPFRREPAEAAVAEGEIVVQPGDTLWAIAENRYGTGFRYSVIYQANAGRIRDPDLIYPGQIFNLPSPDAPR